MFAATATSDTMLTINNALNYISYRQVTVFDVSAVG